jgi:hypothetical protein
MKKVILIVAWFFILGTGISAQHKASPKPKAVPQPDTERVGCQWYLFGFYLEMPEPDALTRTKLLSNESYDYTDKGEVRINVTNSPYTDYASSVFLTFTHGRLVGISAILEGPFPGYQVDEIAAWITRRYGLPNEWEDSNAGKTKDVADSGVVRGARSIHYRGVHFYINNTDRKVYMNMSYE